MEASQTVSTHFYFKNMMKTTIKVSLPQDIYIWGYRATLILDKLSTPL